MEAALQEIYFRYPIIQDFLGRCLKQAWIQLEIKISSQPSFYKELLTTINIQVHPSQKDLV